MLGWIMVGNVGIQSNLWIAFFQLRQHDSEENVRFEVVKAIVATARLDFNIVSESEDLLNYVKERTLDKKVNWKLHYTSLFINNNCFRLFNFHFSVQNSSWSSAGIGLNL